MVSEGHDDCSKPCKRIFMVHFIDKRTVEENFEGTEIGRVRYKVVDKATRHFDCPGGLYDFLSENHGLSNSSSDYHSPEEGKIIFSRMETENAAGADRDQLCAWREGDFKLWRSEYTIYVRFAETRIPNSNELAKHLFIGE